MEINNRNQDQLTQSSRLSDRSVEEPRRIQLNSELQKAMDKQKANKIKATLKHLLKKLDSLNDGLVNSEAFQLLLETHHVKLSVKDFTRLKHETGQNPNGERINYVNALRMIQPNMDLQEPLLREWIVQKHPQESGSQASLSAANISQFSRTSKAGRPFFTTNQQLKQLNATIEATKTQPQQDTIPEVLGSSASARELKTPNPKKHEDAYSTIKDSREKSSSQRQQNSMLPSFSTLVQKPKEATWFDGNQKQNLLSKQCQEHQTSFHTINYESGNIKKPKQEHQQHILYKPSYNIVSNYKGDEAPVHDGRSMSKDALIDSERGSKSIERRKTQPQSKVERPNQMRPSVVDSYIKSVLDLGAHQVISEMKDTTGAEKGKNWVKIIEQIYRLNLDNRILNNLRQQLNELIEDEKGLVSPEIFKKMFFTFFKGERYAYQVFEMLQPIVTEHYDEDEDKLIQTDDPKATDANKVVVIQKLTQFIDMFNFYPIKVHKVRHKNDSNELTYVMNSGVHGTKNDRGETIQKVSPKALTDDERYMIKLLSLVSDKIRERFINLQQCFRFLDTNHSQSISINEFAQAMDHMRLKISFDDIKKLFNYIDKKGQGEIGYDEFTLLLEERWRGIDPVVALRANLANRKPNPMEVSHKKEVNVYDDCPTEMEVFEKLEGYAKNKLKVPIRMETSQGHVVKKIGSQDAENLLAKSKQMQVVGTATFEDSKMADVMKHDYLKRSIEQRVQRKALYNEYQLQKHESQIGGSLKTTNASRLRSQTILSSLSSRSQASFNLPSDRSTTSTNNYQDANPNNNSYRKNLMESNYQLSQKQLRQKLEILQKANRIIFDKQQRSNSHAYQPSQAKKKKAHDELSASSLYSDSHNRSGRDLDKEIIQQSLKKMNLARPYEMSSTPIILRTPQQDMRSNSLTNNKNGKLNAIQEFYKDKKQLISVEPQNRTGTFFNTTSK